jgi:CHASE3 domain sensor protein
MDSATAETLQRCRILRYNAAGTTQRDTDVKKRLTIGRAREWMIALVVVCIAILVLIGVATWWVA